MAKIAFQTPLIDVRGTCVAIYDYAHYNETLLGGKSIIVVPEDGDIDPIPYNKFIRRFSVIKYRSPEHLEEIIKNFDILYCIKYGTNDGVVSNSIKTVIHCVFDLTQPHGDVYAAVSETLARKFNYPLSVPHMIGLKPSRTKDNLRRNLNIPDHAIVFGRHGGPDTFDLQITKAAIRRVVREDPNRYFIFANTPAFDNHPNVRFLERFTDSYDKNKFISTCDACVHAQSLGETFGIAIGEFSVNNKPIITYSGQVWNDHYRNILKDKAFYYHDEESCYQILSSFDPKEHVHKDWNCYRDYSPEKVMEIFKNVFIKGALGENFSQVEVNAAHQEL